MRPLRIGTRGSLLALRQANFVRQELQRLAHASAELVLIKTSGDRLEQAAVSQIGLKGVFIKELEDALLENRVDLAVHSMKDVPTMVPPGLVFPALCKREDIHDALLARQAWVFSTLPTGARVGTSSLRRQAQLRHHRPDLKVCELRGNVDTRVRKLEAGEYDAIVLAKAGLDRLGWSSKITEVLSTEFSLPAVGQGALGIEARAGDRELLGALAQLDDAATRAGITAERALLAELEGGCQLPLGGWGSIDGGELRLEACVLSRDGTEYLRRSARGSPSQAESLGRTLAQTLLRAGADRILRLAGRAYGDH